VLLKGNPATQHPTPTPTPNPSPPLIADSDILRMASEIKIKDDPGPPVCGTGAVVVRRHAEAVLRS